MEVLHDGRVTRASDVYSFGMIMLEMFTGVPVFEGYSSSQVSSWLLDICYITKSTLPSQGAAHRTLQQACWQASSAVLARVSQFMCTADTRCSTACSLEGLLARLNSQTQADTGLLTA